MTVSRLIEKNGRMFFEINKEHFPPCAYITYFEENNDYKAFAEAGCRLFSVTVSMAMQPINAKSGFMPYLAGIFDAKGQADFSAADRSIRMILENCPNAYIFPRINVCMPQWWIDGNPTEVIPVPHEKMREALYSEKFRQTAGEMLRQTIAHFESAEYGDRIFGYQISGGNTQEWFHFDLHGGHHPNALPYFNRFLQQKDPDMALCETLPDIDALPRDGRIQDPYIRSYFEFASRSVAETIEFLCKTAKQAVHFQKVVGTFYGYALEVLSPLWGTHSLSTLLECPYIDFFSSPNSYAFARALGEDWGDMMPADSIKLHGKLCFMENDIRTLYSKSPGNSRAGADPYHVYTDAVWKGPATEELSVAAVRKSFARQLTHNHGLWWFDMFGHWYASESLMAEMQTAFAVYAQWANGQLPEFQAEAAVFIDEKLYAQVSPLAPMAACARKARDVLAKSGSPCHIYLLEDFDRLMARGFPYKAAVFAIPIDTAELSKAVSRCQTQGIPYLRFTEESFLYTPEEYRAFFAKCGLWCYLDTEDVCYVGNGYMAVHAAEAGVKKLRFPCKVSVFDCGGRKLSNPGTAFSVEMKQHETQIFRMEKCE